MTNLKPALKGSIENVSTLKNETREKMFSLMDEFYHADRIAFIQDLKDKSKVILLHDTSGALRGFTSAKVFDLDFNGETLKIVFSGDTIIHPDFWGTLELPKVWGKFMLDTISEIGDSRLFWLLISSGYKTYRFLPAYFHEFFPRHDKETPSEMQLIMNAAAKHMFKSGYNAETGIIKLKHPTPLKSGISDPTPERMKNPHIAYFLEKNPGYKDGEELTCITRLETDNIKPFVKRLIRAK